MSTKALLRSAAEQMGFSKIQNAAESCKKRVGKKCFFYHTCRTNPNKIPVKLLRIDTLIIKPRQSFQLIKTIKPLIKILDL